MTDITEVADLEVRVKGSGVDQTAASLDKLTGSSDRAEQSTQKLERAERAAAAAQRQAAKEAADLAARIAHVRAVADPAAAAQDRLNKELAEAASLYKMGAIDAATYGKAVSNINANAATAAGMMGRFGVGSKSAAAGSKLASHEVLNLSRQFSDIAVTGAMGMNPIMIAIQQGPQLAETFAAASARGIGFVAVLKQMVGLAAPFLAAIAPIALAVGAVAAGFALLHREASKGYPTDITDGLNLTAEQLERVESKTVTFGDTLRATFKVIGDYIMAGPVGTAIEWLGTQWDILMDGLVKASFEGVVRILAFFTASYKTIVKSWDNLPGAFGAIFIAAGNAAIDAIEWMVNGNIRLLNKFFSAWMGVFGKTAVAIPELQAERFTATPGGRAEASSQFFESTYQAEVAGFRAAGKSMLKEIADTALAAARARALKEAGKPNKGSSAAGPRDTEDQRSNEIDRMIAQAKAEELNAQLAVTHGLEERTAIQRQMLKAEEEVKAAELARFVLKVENDKGLDRAEKDALLLRLDEVKTIRERIAGLKDQALTDALAEAKAAERLQLEEASIDLTIDRLSVAQANAATEAERTRIGLMILAHEHKLERLRLEAVANNEKANAADREAAKMRLAHLDELQEGERRASYNAQTAYDQVAGALGDVRSAIKSKDWGGVFGALNSAVQALILAMEQGGDAILGALSGLGSLIGGKMGRAVSGLMGALQLGSTLGALGGLGGAGGGIGGLVGGIGGAMGMGGAMGGLQGAAFAGLSAIPGVGGFMSSGVAGAAGLAGGTGGLLGALGASMATNPIGWIIGGGLLLGSLLGGGKPSNHGAGVGFDDAGGYFLTGNKRNEETTEKANSLAEGVLAGIAALEQTGAKITDTVHSIVIGTRDLSQITLKSGRMLTSATGDVEAAAETALRALLEGAEFANSAQQAMVDGMLASGDSFTEIVAALDQFQQMVAQATAFIQSIPDQILKLTDARAYDLTMLERAQAARRAQLDAYLAAGHIGQGEYDTAIAQLAQLDALELAETLSKYEEAVVVAASAANDMADGMARAIEGLRAFYDELTGGSLSGLGVDQRYALSKAAFQQAAAANDIENLERLARDFEALSRQMYASGGAYFLDQQSIKNAIEKATGLPITAGGGAAPSGASNRSTDAGGIAAAIAALEAKIAALINQGGSAATAQIEALEAMIEELSGVRRNTAAAA